MTFKLTTGNKKFGILDRSPSPDAPGVPDHILNLLPCHRVGANKRLLREGIQCLICLNPYQPTQYVKKLPKCNHYFHRDCIDTWLQNHRGNFTDGEISSKINFQLALLIIKKFHFVKNHQKDLKP